MRRAIQLPQASSIIGIRDSCREKKQQVIIYFNSVYIGGSGVLAGGSNSFAFFSDVVTNTRSFRDNIFWNARSNAFWLQPY